MKKLICLITVLSLCLFAAACEGGGRVNDEWRNDMPIWKDWPDMPPDENPEFFVDAGTGFVRIIEVTVGGSTYPTQTSWGIGAIDAVGCGFEFDYTAPEDGVYSVIIEYGALLAGSNYMNLFVDNVQQSSFNLVKNTAENWNASSDSHDNYVFLTEGIHTIKMLRVDGAMFVTALKVRKVGSAQNAAVINFNADNIISGASYGATNGTGPAGKLLNSFADGGSFKFNYTAQSAGTYRLVLSVGSVSNPTLSVSVNGGAAEETTLLRLISTSASMANFNIRNAIEIALSEGSNEIAVTAVNGGAAGFCTGAAMIVKAEV